MKGGSFRIDVQRFVLDEGGTPPRLLVDLWLGGDVAFEAMALRLPDAEPRMIAELRSFDHREGLVRCGLRCPVAPIPPETAWGEATLELDAANGDRMAFAIGDLFRRTTGPVVLPEEVVPLTLGGDAALDALAAGEGWAGAALFGRAAPGGLVATDAFAIADAIADDFAGLRSPGDLLLHAEGGAWRAISYRYGFRFETGRPASDARDAAREAFAAEIRPAVEAVRAALAAAVPLLVRAASPRDGEDAEAALAEAIRARNPAARLLWTDASWGEAAAPAILETAPGLVRALPGDWSELLPAVVGRILEGQA